MSYEGFTQYLCENRHEYMVDVYDYEGRWCPYCDSTKVVWSNEVDETNGDEMDGELINGFIELEKDEPAQVEMCNLGHHHVVRHETYKIPEDNEKARRRTAEAHKARKALGASEGADV